jgi:hypothetical protein
MHLGPQYRGGKYSQVREPLLQACSMRSHKRHWVKRSFVPHTEGNDAVHHLRDDEMDQAEGGSWVLCIISTIIVLAGIVVIVLAWFQRNSAKRRGGSRLRSECYYVALL